MQSEKRKTKTQNLKILTLNFKFAFYILSFTLLNIIGCATAPVVLPPKLEGISGVYHCIEKGQTLWRLSKIFNVDLEELARLNNISDASSIEEGQLIFIPRARKQQDLNFKNIFSDEDFIWPLKGKVISSFGQTSNDMVNKGIDIQASSNSNVLAARSGKVIFYADNFFGYGKTIIIEHGDGFLTVYARNSDVFVKIGDVIQKGSIISKIGFTGRLKDRYLHFELRKGYIPQNPSFYLPR